jgi:hypothetical protein
VYIMWGATELDIVNELKAVEKGEQA